MPEVVNLVFLKPVWSETKFWQMMGRGPRLRPDLHGPGADKQDFLVLDFCENLEFFNADPATAEGVVAMSLGERLFKARLELIGVLDTQSPDAIPRTRDGTQSTNGLRWDTAFLLHETVVAMNPDNFVVRPHRRWVETYAEPDASKHLSAPGVERLRRQVQDTATALLQQTGIPAIQAQAVLLEEIAGDDWWVDVTLPMLELARRRIRTLIADREV